MLTATGLEVRAGSRLLLDAATFRIAASTSFGRSAGERSVASGPGSSGWSPDTSLVCASAGARQGSSSVFSSAEVQPKRWFFS